MLPILLLSWPSALANGDIGKQLAAVSLICMMYAIFVIKPISLKKDLIGLMFAVYFSYLILNLLINPLLHGNGSFRDFAEIVRIFGCISAMCLGASLGFSHIKSTHIYWVLTLLIILELGFILNIFSFPFDFYSTRTARFSGYAIGVNYVFTTVLFITIILSYNKHQVSNYLAGYSIIVLIIALGLSGSRTSIAIIFIAILLYSFWKFKFLLKIHNFLILAFMYFSWSYISDFDTIQRLMKVVNVLATLDFTLEDFPTLFKRYLMWNQYMPLILDRLYIGYGGAKDILRIIDNSFLMTVLRYGLIGLFLEISIYVSMLLLCFRISNGLTFAIFILCYLVSGITTSFMYELRAPYLLFYVFGVIWKDSYVRYH